MRDGSGQVEQVRRQNTALVLRALRSDGPLTRTEIARRIGLAKATVGSIVGDLETAGLAAETGELTGGRGRPGRAVALTGETVVGLGLEVNVDYVATVTLDVSGAIQHAESVSVAGRLPLDVLAEVASRRVRDIRQEGGRLAGVTAAVPGLVDIDRRIVRWAPNLDWHDLDLGVALERATGVPDVTVDNDANCAAIGESGHGAVTGIDDALYLTGTIGIGAGWIVGGRLVRGHGGLAGEVGHLPLGAPDALCGCGRQGCWEASIGLRAALAATGVAEVGTPWDSAEAVADAARRDPQVASAVARIGDRLGHGIAVLAGFADPEAVVLGGYFVPLAEWLLPAAEESLRDHLSFSDLHRPVLRLSPLGLQAAALGAAESALDRVLTGSIP